MSTRSDPYRGMRQVVFAVTMVAMTAVMVVFFLICVGIAKAIADLYQ